jgi:hypothetical protein
MSTANTLTLPAITGNVITSADSNTVTQSMINRAGFYGGFGPAFSAYNTGGQSVTGGAYTKLQINTEEFDTANCYDSTTNYRFTPNIAGYYLFTFNAENGAASARLTTYLYKNGSVFKNGVDSIGNGTNSNSSNGSALAYANGSSDYFELYVQGNNAQSIQSGAAVTYFQAFLVRPA